jgi:hypothetical protein
MPTWTFNPALTDLVSQVRFHGADATSDPERAMWNDQELQYCLSLVGNVPELAAAKALRAAAADQAKLAFATSLGQLANDETEVYKALIAMADNLEHAAVALPVYQGPPSAFSRSGYPRHRDRNEPERW